jgi:hypothetical protein
MPSQDFNVLVTPVRTKDSPSIDEPAREAPTVASTFRPLAWAGYTACIWALVFAAISFYWAAGGTAGRDTIGPALVQSWGRVLPRRALLSTAWGGGILMALYGGASWVQEGLMVFGVIRIPAGLGHTAALWHVVLWDPWWLLGGILFIIAAWSYRRRTSDQGERLS